MTLPLADAHRLRSTIDVTIDAVLVIDEDVVILQANPAASHLFV